ncbi:unnamed protein product [Rangifer tarandus platyrhynchus]|uniref:Uncharacterized protein n=1 Tax=Rangifer tarandus platyrhynchus TaxID=3082113 RepID=A0AC59ZP64_RANTA
MCRDLWHQDRNEAEGTGEETLNKPGRKGKDIIHPLATGQSATLLLAKTKDTVLASVMCHRGDSGTLGGVGWEDSWVPAAREGARGPALGSQEPLFAESHLPASTGSEQKPRPSGT